MTSEEKSKITDINKCNFTEMSEYFKAQSEARKQMSKDEKLVRPWTNMCTRARTHRHTHTVHIQYTRLQLTHPPTFSNVIPTFSRKSKRRMSVSSRSMVSVWWTTIRSELETFASSLPVCSGGVGTTQRWACWNAASALKTSLSTAASESPHLHHH